MEERIEKALEATFHPNSYKALERAPSSLNGCSETLPFFDHGMYRYSSYYCLLFNKVIAEAHTHCFDDLYNS
jgi:hypothetical protein